MMPPAPTAHTSFAAAAQTAFSVERVTLFTGVTTGVSLCAEVT